VKRLFLIVMPLLATTACTSRYATNAEHVYLQSHNGPQLVVPAPLARSNLSYFYVLPPQKQDPRVSIIPPGMAINT